MRRTIATVAAIATTLIGVAACGDSGSEQPAQDPLNGEGKTIKVWLMVDAESSWKDVVEDANRRFTEKTKAQVYLLTPTVIKEDLGSPENRKLEEYCRAVRAIAAEKKCRLVDLNDLFNLTIAAARLGGADFHPTSDGVHMRPAGDFLMGAAILREMGVPISKVLDVAAPPTGKEAGR